MTREPRFEIVGTACELLSQWTGFEFREAAPGRLAEFLEMRSRTTGFESVSDYLNELSRLPNDADEPQRLINLITNGLTAFWRDEPQLEALRAVMREIWTRRGRTLNIWCGGCSTGEEAYTAAIIAREEGIDAAILGTDINTDFLGRAIAGRYDTWSLRRLDEGRKERWFEGLGREQWRIAEELRENVSFRRHNLQARAPLPPDRADWDIILCRNVIIYFGKDATLTVLGHFAESLHPNDGYLILGSSEQLSSSADAVFRASRVADGFVYRNRDTKPGSSVPFQLPAVREEESDVPDFEPTSLDEETIDFGEDDAVLRLLDAGRHHLELGRTAAALACFEAAAGYDPFVPEIHCLLGHAFEGADAPNEALDSYQKSLFLDPGFWFAAWRSAVIAESLDELDIARRALRQVERCLNEGPSSMPSPRMTGDTLGDLKRAERQARSAIETPGK